jgi:hypothetical protein
MSAHLLHADWGEDRGEPVVVDVVRWAASRRVASCTTRGVREVRPAFVRVVLPSSACVPARRHDLVSPKQQRGRRSCGSMCEATHD